MLESFQMTPIKRNLNQDKKQKSEEELLNKQWKQCSNQLKLRNKKTIIEIQQFEFLANL